MAIFHGVSLPSMTFIWEHSLACRCCCHGVCATAVSARLLLFPCHCPSVGIWAGRAPGGWIIRGWASPTPLPVSDMEVMRAQELCCDPAQLLDTNRNNWVARPGLARGVTKGTGNRHTASCAPSHP